MSPDEQAGRSADGPQDVNDVPDPPTLFGQFYPEEGVLAVVPDLTAGEAIQSALVARGVPAVEVLLVSGDDFVAATAHLREDRGLIERMVALYKQEVDQLMDRYVEQAQAGRVIVVVHAGDDERTDLVAQVLADHRAEMVHHYGQYSIRRLN